MGWQIAARQRELCLRLVLQPSESLPGPDSLGSPSQALVDNGGLSISRPSGSGLHQLSSLGSWCTQAFSFPFTLAQTSRAQNADGGGNARREDVCLFSRSCFLKMFMTGEVFHLLRTSRDPGTGSVSMRSGLPGVTRVTSSLRGRTSSGPPSPNPMCNSEKRGHLFQRLQSCAGGGQLVSIL